MRSLMLLLALCACLLKAHAYNYAGKYTFAARWNEATRYTSGGITVYPEEFGNLNQYDVCPPKQVSVIFPSAVVAGNIKQTCDNLWIALIESNYLLSSSSSKTRAKDLSEDWFIDYVNPNDSTSNYYFNWYANQYLGTPVLWGDPVVLRSVYPLVLKNGPHDGEAVLGNDSLLAFGDKLFVMLDTDGSLSYYLYGASGLLYKDSTATTFTNGAWDGQSLVNKLKYMIGFEETRLYFLEGSSTLHVFDRDLKWLRTETVALGHELSAYTMGDLVDNKIPGYTYIGWDLGPIVIGVSALRPLDHVEVTTTSAGSPAGSLVTFVIKACGTSDCGTLYTRGLSGNLVLSDGSSVPFIVPAGSSSVSVGLTVASVPASGTVTVGLAALNPSPAGTPSLYCGFGVPASSSATCDYAVTSPLHHLAITTPSASGLTCTPSIFTVTACANAACSSYYTGGLTGNLVIGGAGGAVTPSATNAFAIASGAYSQTVGAQITTPPTAGYATLAVNALSLAPSGSPGLYCGLGAAPTASGSCNYAVSPAGFLIAVPNHAAEAASTLTITAVKQGTSSASCVPAFASVSKAVAFKCAYANPGSGTRPVRLNGRALNASNSVTSACDAGGASISMAFNAGGVATVPLQYADVGQMTVSGSYTGTGSEAGLSMNGGATFIATPAAITWSNLPAAAIKAGASFTSTVSVVNSAGTATPNFGLESPAATVALAFAKAKPTGVSSVSGTFTGPAVLSFSSGVATPSMSWSEVGYGDLSATLTGGSYLGVGTPVSGTTGAAGAVGPFVPDRFTVSAVNQCAGTFTFSGQPFELNISAVNKAGDITRNYDGTASTSPNQANPVTLSVAGNSAGVAGILSLTTLAASSFSQGLSSLKADAASPLRFTYTNKESAPTKLSIGVVEGSGGHGVQGASPGDLALRSGRLRLFNKFGSEKQPMTMVVQSQYWADKAWVLNALDEGCTKVPLTAISLSGYKNNQGVATSAWSTTASVSTSNSGKYATSVSGQPALRLSGGQSEISLSAPSPAATGSVDVALNLGLSSATTDASCLSTHAPSTGAGVPWLRSRNGNCSAAFDRDPSARATFGIYSPETSKTIYGRELY